MAEQITAELDATSSNSMMRYRMAGFLAVAAMLGFLAAFAGITFRQIPTQNRDFFNMALVALIGFVGTAFGYYLGSSQGSARKTELQAMRSLDETPLKPVIDNRQAGRVRVAMLLWMSVLCFVLAFGMAGCAENQSATRQIADQTDNPGYVALAVYADAQDAYIEAELAEQDRADRLAAGIWKEADFPADLVAAVRDAKTKLDEIAAIKTEAIKI